MTFSGCLTRLSTEGTRMPRNNPAMGAKVRAIRQRNDMTQVALADELDISASYLNLIEHGRRPLPAHLLIKLSQVFDVDLDEFDAEQDEKLASDLGELFGDSIFEGFDLAPEEIHEFAAQSPGVARAFVSLYERFRELQDSMQTLTSRITTDQADLDKARPGIEAWRLPTEEVNDFVQRHGNYFPKLEEAAGELWEEADLQPHDLFGGLTRYLSEELDVEVKIVPGDETSNSPVVREYDPDRRLLLLSEVLDPNTRVFQTAHQIGLLTRSSLFDELSGDGRLTTSESQALCRVALANYFAGAVMMPYDDFLEAAEDFRYDLDMLTHRFEASFEQVCHRLTTLRKPGEEGVPFHFIRVDIAGNISKRFSASGIQFARFSGACPRWNLVGAFLTPGQIRVQVSEFPDGRRYMCVARTVNRGEGRFHSPPAMHTICLGCKIEDAEKLVYSDGIDLYDEDSTVPVGVTCRLCERMDCEQRAFPPLQKSLDIDENSRGRSFYANVKE